MIWEGHVYFLRKEKRYGLLNQGIQGEKLKSVEDPFSLIE